MNFSDYLTQWLTRHPLKGRAEPDQAGYTAQVMKRVHNAGTCPRRGLVPDMAYKWLRWPQAGWSFAAAAAGLLVAVWSVQQATSPQTAERRITSEAELLAQLEDPVNGLVEPDLAEEAAELDAEELVHLAEAPETDEAWVAETLELLDQLEETTEPDTGSSGPSQEEWLQEMELLDDQELATSSS